MPPTRFNAGGAVPAKPKEKQQQHQQQSTFDFLAAFGGDDSGPPPMELQFSGILTGSAAAGMGGDTTDQNIDDLLMMMMPEDDLFMMAGDHHHTAQEQQVKKPNNNNNSNNTKKGQQKQQLQERDHLDDALFSAAVAASLKTAEQDTPFNFLTEPKRGVLRLPPGMGDDGVVPDVMFVTGSNGESRWVTWQEDKPSLCNNDDDEAVEDYRHASLLLRSSVRSAVEIDNAAADQKEHHRNLERILAGGGDRNNSNNNNNNNSNNNKMTASSTSTASSHHHDEQQKSHGVAGDQLWVSRYCPKHFSELLSDERVNLEVLQWMMSWKRYLIAASEEKERKASGGSGGGAASPFGVGGFGKSKAAASAAAATASTSSSSVPTRPESIIALVTGPAGTGKTTLAHVIARHCGFDAIEVNASYNRSEKDMRNLFVTATADTNTAAAKNFEQSHHQSSSSSSTSLQADKLLKPKCLILDECDGSTVSVVKTLLATPLHRPVICIANNLYAPALRELRSSTVCFVRQVPPLTPQRIASRLEAICDLEKVNIDRSSLMDLSLHCAGDIRQCLNTLFFVSRQVPAVEQRGSLSGGGGGGVQSASRLLKMLRVREPTTSMWSMWENCLERKEKGKYVSALVSAGVMTKEEAARAANMALVMPPSSGTTSSGGETTMSSSMTKFDVGTRWVARCAAKCPDLEMVLNGLHEWYCQLNYPDYTFHSTAQLCDAFAWCDRSDPFTSHFSAICESVAVIVFRTCATLQQRPPHIRSTVPREQTAWNAEKDKYAETIAAFVASNTHCRDAKTGQNIGSVVRSWCGPDAAAQDVLPFFVQLVSLIPAGLKLAPGVTQLSNVRNVKDAEALQRLVEIMATFGITFEHDAAKAAVNASRASKSGASYASSSISSSSSNNNRQEIEWRMSPDYEQWTELKRTTEALARQQQGLAVSKRYHNNGNGNSKYGAKGDHNITPETGIMRAAAGLTSTAINPHLSSLMKKSVFDVNMKKAPNDVRALLVGEVTKATATMAATAASAGTRRQREEDEADDEKKKKVTTAEQQQHQQQPHGEDTRAVDHTTVSPSKAPVAVKQEVTSAAAVNRKAAAAGTTVAAISAPVARDFFGRPIVKKEAASPIVAAGGSSSKQQQQHHAQQPHDVNPVKYRFFDGATNSVRKAATSADFM